MVEYAAASRLFRVVTVSLRECRPGQGELALHQDTTDRRIRAIFARLFEVAPESVGEKTRRGELERWDSLGHLELLEALRTEFKVQIQPDEALAMETFADVKRTLARLGAA